MSEKNSEFSVKIHDRINGRVVAICDSDLLGKTLKNKDFKVEVSKSFYGGEILDEFGIIKIFEKERNINIIGKRIVELCMKLNIINKDHVIYIGDIPHIQLIEL